jgi:hypothetical protein
MLSGYSLGVICCSLWVHGLNQDENFFMSLMVKLKNPDLDGHVWDLESILTVITDLPGLTDILHQNRFSIPATWANDPTSGVGASGCENKPGADPRCGDSPLC